MRKINSMILENIENNIKQYVIVVLIFLIGILTGTIFINTINQGEKEESKSYINESVQNIKNNGSINYQKLLEKTLKNNLFLVLILWIAGGTVIGISIIYITVFFRGFCMSYTIANIIITIGTWQGIAFTLSSMLLQSIIIIPAIISLGVSGINLYKEIMKNRRRENIKQKIYKHTIFSGITAFFMIIAAFIETYLSGNLILICKNMF